MATEVRAIKRELVFRYRSPLHWIEVFRTYYGPLNRTFAAIDADKQAAFTHDLLELLGKGPGDRPFAGAAERVPREVVIDRR